MARTSAPLDTSSSTWTSHSKYGARGLDKAMHRLQLVAHLDRVTELTRLCESLPTRHSARLSNPPTQITKTGNEILTSRDINLINGVALEMRDEVLWR